MTAPAPSRYEAALLCAADEALAAHDAELAWAIVWLFADESRNTGHVRWRTEYLTITFGNRLAPEIRRGLVKLSRLGLAQVRLGDRTDPFSENEVRLDDGAPPV